ncbi:MAG: type II toxin-antitoxin system HicB family antitoxin [Anaerolineae bacterium]
MANKLRYTIILQPETDPDFVGYYNASVPALPGCFSYGASREEALKNIKEAIELYLEDLIAMGEPFPEEQLEQVEVVV